MTEALYLLAFSCYVIFFYLQTTTFAMRVPGVIYSIVRGALFFCGLYRLYLYRKDYSLLEVTALASFMGLGLFYLIAGGDTLVLDASLITVGACRVSLRKIGIIYIYIGVLISILALICSQTGVIPDYVFQTNYGENDHLRHSFGIIYPTDCFAHVFYLVITYLIVRWKRITYIELSLTAILLAVAFYFTHARVDMAGAVLMLIIVLILKTRGFKPLNISDRITKPVVSLMMPLFAVFITVVTYFYDPENSLMYVLDSKLSYRLSLGKTGMSLYGFKLMGNSSFAENGNANGGIRNYSYVFYDSAYIKYLFKYGVVLLLVLFVIYALIGIRLIRERMLYGMVFISILALSFIIEHHMLELSYNITLVLLTADISTILQTEPLINKYSKNGIIT